MTNPLKKHLSFLAMCAFALLNGVLCAKGMADTLYSVLACVGVVVSACVAVTPARVRVVGQHAIPDR